MVLSLGFILAFIGAAVALLIGILIFSEVEGAITCPAPSQAGVASVLFDHSGVANESVDLDSASGLFGAAGGGIGQIITLSSEEIATVTYYGLENTLSSTTIAVRIYSNVTDTDLLSNAILEDTSDTLDLSTMQSQTFNHQFTFTTQPTLTGSDIYVGIFGNVDDAFFIDGFTTSQSAGSVSSSIGEDPDGIITDFQRFWSPVGNGITNGGQDMVDVAMKVTLAGGSPPIPADQGSEECQSAKDTAWTVIGILPVALFFALFAIFGSLGRQS